MELSRRGFFKTMGAAVASSIAYEALAAAPALAVEPDAQWKLTDTKEYSNICCYCACGCGSICSVRDGELINLEGDPDHPVNEGGLCPKGASMWQLRNVIDPITHEPIKNQDRVSKPMVRRPGASEWEVISWDEAIDEITRKVKDTRDQNFTTVDANGLTVNRCEAIASLGGSQQNSEEEYLITKMMRSLGIVTIDNQARVCHSSTVVGLAASFGRGSMTNHPSDMKNTDVILNCGSNSAENHPVTSKWLNKAHENGAKWIVVDPRYTRTAEMADIYCPIRSGTDIAFYGGLINYIFDNDLWQHEYVLNYTNASYLLDPDFAFDPATGLWSGFDGDDATYDNHSWHYQVESETEWDTAPGGAYSWAVQPGVPAFTPPTVEHPKRDATLQDPMCVFQQLKKHYSRYTLDTVSQVCGCDKDLLELTYKTYASTGAPEKSGTILYALGQTQHTYGAQNTRAMSMVQLLLGNVGVAGGGVNALRGEPNVQGATDMGMLVNEAPAYLKWPNDSSRNSLRNWLQNETYSAGYYTNKPKFLISMLKEWWGEHATVDNDYGYDWWPKVAHGGEDHTIIPSFELMSQGVVKGYFCWGMNPAGSAPNAANVLECLSNLEWLVVVDQVQTDTATFWAAPGVDPSKVNTEVYLLPCALIYEKPGLILNTGRWLQYRHQAVEPWDEAKPDYEICDLLWTKLVDMYRSEGGALPEAILNAKWDYYVDGKLDPRSVAIALNGYRVAGTDLANGKADLVSGYGDLAADGSTSCAMWIYSGFWNNNDDPWNPEIQPVCSRDAEDPTGLCLFPKWAYAWPNNRRILYNRASADANGVPWNPDKVLVEWNGTKWVTNDNPDFVAVRDGAPVPPNDDAFFMLWEQNARLESYSMADGPMPEHYEPFESPTDVNPFNGAFSSPCMRFDGFESTRHGSNKDYPIAATTYSVVEHWQTGDQTQMCPALIEAMPVQFIELSPELAESKGIKAGDKVRVFNNRGSVIVDCVITNRFKPFTVNGEKVHQVGLTHHFGWAGVYANSSSMVNDITPNVGDPNSQIPEYKAFLVDIERA